MNNYGIKSEILLDQQAIIWTIMKKVYENQT